MCSKCKDMCKRCGNEVPYGIHFLSHCNDALATKSFWPFKKYIPPRCKNCGDADWCLNKVNYSFYIKSVGYFIDYV